MIFVLYFVKESGDREEDKIPIGGFAIGMFEGMSFLFGAFCSAFSGYSGMWVSIRTNSRWKSINIILV
jgi:hypothetical protein